MVSNSSTVSTAHGERLDSGWYNSNFESSLREEWCTLEFKREKFESFSSSSLITYIDHMSNAAYLDLLQEDDSTNDDSMLPFFENPINVDDDITKTSCIACIDAGEL